MLSCLLFHSGHTGGRGWVQEQVQHNNCLKQIPTPTGGWGISNASTGEASAPTRVNWKGQTSTYQRTSWCDQIHLTSTKYQPVRPDLPHQLVVPPDQTETTTKQLVYIMKWQSHFPSKRKGPIRRYEGPLHLPFDHKFVWIGRDV